MNTNFAIEKYLNIENISFEEENYNLDLDINENNFIYNVGVIYKIFKSTYLNNGILLYIFNDYPFDFEQYLENICTLYKYTKDNKILNVQFYLANLISNLQYTLEKSQIYNTKHISKVFYDFFDRKHFYNNGDYIVNSYNYINHLLTIINDSNFLLNNIIKLHKQLNRRIYNDFFNNLLNNNLNIAIFYKYDYELSSHKNLYNTFILNKIKDNTIYSSGNTLNLLLCLNENKSLCINTFKYYLNNIINHINDIISINSYDDINIFQTIVKIDEINKILIKLKSKNMFENRYLNKINECIKTILCFKRHILKTNDISKSMKAETCSLGIDRSYIQDIKNKIVQNNLKIFNCLKINFDNKLKETINHMLEGDCMYMTKQMNVDNDIGIYNYFKSDHDSAYSRYYNDKAKSILKKRIDNYNNFSNDYYSKMLLYINLIPNSDSFIATYSLDENDIAKIKEYTRNNLLQNNNILLDNDYILCTYLILCIESAIYDQITYANITHETFSKDLEKLFVKYSDNIDCRNVYMFVNYVLYDELGLKYRNNFMHGNIIHKKDFSIELLYILACIIGLDCISYIIK